MLPDPMREAELRRAVEERLTACWRAWGYREVLPPPWLPWEEVGFGLTGLPGQACKLLDPEGQVVSLRPDNTLLVARLAARELADQPRPLRLCYCADVFRRPRSGGLTAVPQAGLELVGSSSPLADAEVLALAAESLRVLGVEEFRLAVGHVGVLRDLLESAGLPAGRRQEVMEALQRRDFVALERALASRDELWERLTVPVPAERFQAGAGEDGRNLAEVLALLRTPELRGKVVVELGLVRDLDYYTGLVFEMAAPGVAGPLGGGGRYDGLLGRFGRSEPATGFAFELRGLLQLLAGRGPDGPSRSLVVPADGGLEAAWARARRIRAAGGVAELDVSGRSLEEALEYARRRGMRAVIAVSAAGEEEIVL